MIPSPPPMSYLGKKLAKDPSASCCKRKTYGSCVDLALLGTHLLECIVPGSAKEEHMN